MTAEAPENDSDAALRRRLVKAYALLEANLTRAEAGTHQLALALERHVGPCCHPKVTRFPLRGVYRAIVLAPRRPDGYQQRRYPAPTAAPEGPDPDPPPRAS